MIMCAIPECHDDAVTSHLCAKHYQQKRRGTLGAVSKRVANGEGDAVTFRVSKAERKMAEEKAKARGVALSEYCRLALRRLMNLGK